MADKEAWKNRIIKDLKEKDFNKFIVGKTLTKINDSVATFDFKQYYDKIFLKKGETKTVNFKLTPEDLRDPKKAYNKFSVEDFTKLTGFNCKDLLNKMQVFSFEKLPEDVIEAIKSKRE